MVPSSASMQSYSYLALLACQTRHAAATAFTTAAGRVCFPLHHPSVDVTSVFCEMLRRAASRPASIQDCNVSKVQKCRCSNPSDYMTSNVVSTAATWCKSTHVNIGLQHTGSAEEQEQQQQLEGLLESAARMLPAAQQGLATAPHQTSGPALALTTSTAAGQVTASCLNPVELAPVAAATHLSCGCSHTT